jgi:hypothetical protein
LLGRKAMKERKKQGQLSHKPVPRKAETAKTQAKKRIYKIESDEEGGRSSAFKSKKTRNNRVKENNIMTVSGKRDPEIKLIRADDSGDSNGSSQVTQQQTQSFEAQHTSEHEHSGEDEWNPAWASEGDDKHLGK